MEFKSPYLIYFCIPCVGSLQATCNQQSSHPNKITIFKFLLAINRISRPQISCFHLHVLCGKVAFCFWYYEYKHKLMCDLYPTPSSKFFFLTVTLIVSLFLSFQSMMTRKSGLVVNFGVGELCIFVVEIHGSSKSAFYYLPELLQ